MAHASTHTHTRTPGRGGGVPEVFEKALASTLPFTITIYDTRQLVYIALPRHPPRV